MSGDMKIIAKFPILQQQQVKSYGNSIGEPLDVIDINRNGHSDYDVKDNFWLSSKELYKLKEPALGVSFQSIEDYAQGHNLTMVTETEIGDIGVKGHEVSFKVERFPQMYEEYVVDVKEKDVNNRSIHNAVKELTPFTNKENMQWGIDVEKKEFVIFEGIV